MSKTPAPGPKDVRESVLREIPESESCPFGPSFFAHQLRAFVRARCPDPSEALPSVQLHLADGDAIEICHIIGIAPRWLALAVIEEHRPVAAPTMRTEIVPYELVSRVTVRPFRPGSGHVGFEVERNPELLSGRDTPEAAFLAMAGVTRSVPESAPPETGAASQTESAGSSFPDRTGR
jgi:hypothetical protein